MKTRLGILGAGSFVADCLIPQLQERYEITTVSRAGSLSPPRAAEGAVAVPIPDWISLAPILALPERLDILSELGARRVVALSSTSLFTKAASSEPSERALSQRIRESEGQLAGWAEHQSVEWLVLRPTLIYGRGRDRNISEIARFIRRFGFFPVIAPARGRRQPIHCEDVASACVRALEARPISNCAYNISGGEVLEYRDMVVRIFQALARPPRVIAMPLWAFSGAIACARLFPRWRDWSTAMAARMNEDLVFDHSAAARDFGFSPRGFRPDPADLPA